MTKDLNQNQTEQSNKEVKEQAVKKATTRLAVRIRSFFVKVIAICSLVFFGYYGFQFWKSKSENLYNAKSQVKKFDNVESEIFDLSEHENSQGYDNYSELGERVSEEDSNLLDMTAKELEQKGSEFIYQMLLKNQIQINNLSEQIFSLREEIAVYKNRERIGQLVFAYVELRQKIYSLEDYYESLRNFEILASFDDNLTDKLSKLRPLIPLFVGKKKLIKEFDNSIPKLIATKTHDPESGLIAKIRHNISKLVTIRKVGETSGDLVDENIAKIKRLLEEEDYQEALDLAKTLDAKFSDVLKSFLSDLGVAANLKKIDQEIFNYLKGLS